MPSKFSIVLNAPEIPGNTGSIGRTCVALGVRLILIHPLAFDISEKAVRRAGLDYWKYVELTEYDNFDAFLEAEAPARDKLFFFSRFKQDRSYYDAGYSEGCYLIFGSETTGLPTPLLSQFEDRTFSLPMFSPHIRSLNLANTATAAAFEALRCQMTFGTGRTN